MALLNFGTVPGGAAGNELAAVTRRAVMPAVTVQIGKSTVALSAVLAAAEPVYGGVSPVTLPLQGTRMVQGGWSDYSGQFGAPQVLPGLMNAEFNLAAFVVGIPYFMFEGMDQQDAEIVPIIWARMNDAGNYTADQLALAFWAALSANNNLMPFSINDMMAATDPAQGAYGNLPVATNAFWKGNAQSIATINPASAAWSRVNALAAIGYAQKASGGEPPSAGLCSPGAWQAIAADTIGNDLYLVDKDGTYGDAAEGATIAFPALNIGGIPIYADLYASDDTHLWLPNFNYFQAKIHADAAFAVAGPESLLPQFQLGYVMALFVLLAFVTSKRNAQSVVSGFTGAFAI
jgi:hypothetical protein